MKEWKNYMETVMIHYFLPKNFYINLFTLKISFLYYLSDLTAIIIEQYSDIHIQFMNKSVNYKRCKN